MYVRVYEDRINWENLPSMRTALEADNLNKMDYALERHDSKIDELDKTKAEQEDLLQTVHAVDYDSSTGEIRFIFWSGRVHSIFLNGGGAFNTPSFGVVQVGVEEITADQFYETLKIAAQNIGIALDSQNKQLTFSINEANLKGVVSSASQSNSGWMSAADKTKLDGISESADSVSISRTVTSGKKIATVYINGVGVDLYCDENTDTRDFKIGTSRANATNSVLYFIRS